MRTRYLIVWAALLVTSHSNAAVMQFSQFIGGIDYNYSIDDQALTLSMEPFELSIAVTNGIEYDPRNSNAKQPPFDIVGGTSYYATFNTPGKLPLETTVIRHTVRSTITITDFIVDSDARLTISGGGGDPIAFTIPYSGTITDLVIPHTVKLEGVHVAGSWTIQGDGDEFYSGVFDVPFMAANYGGFPSIRQINLGPYPASAPLIGSGFSRAGMYTSATFFSGTVSTLPFTLSLPSLGGLVIGADGVITAPLPLPTGLLLLPTALAFVATRLRRRKPAL